jgi:hypothetical protein
MKKTVPATESEKERDLLLHSVRETLQTVQGRRFTWWVLSQCGIYSQNVSANSTMYILEGQRSIGLKVIELMGEVDPKLYPEMLLEQAREKSAFRKDGEDVSHVSDSID